MMKKILGLIAIAFLAMNVQLNAQTIIYQEDFNSAPWGGLPAGWSLYFEADSMAINWRISTLVTNPSQGLKHGVFYAYQNQDTANNWTVSVPIILTIDNILTFAERVWKSTSSASLASADAGVYISNGSPLPSSGDFVKIHAFDTTSLGNAQTFAVNLAQYAGDTVYLGFHYFGLGGTYNYGIDDLVISSPAADGGIVRIASPKGTAYPGSIQDVKVDFKNYGNTVIDTVSINWTINGVAQSTYVNNTLGLNSGDSIQITLGSYNFNSGIYTISATSTVPTDNNTANDTASGTYSILPTVDLSVIAISPKGSFPITGSQVVKAWLRNYGTVVANSAQVNWYIDGVAQTQYTGTFLNILPGDSLEVTLGSGIYNSGPHTTAAAIANANDVNPNNDSLSVTSVNGLLFEDFEGEFPSEGWSNTYGFKDDITSAIQGTWNYESSTAVNIFGTIYDTLFTPYLDIQAGDTLAFWLRLNPFYPTTFQVLARDKATGAVTLLSTVTTSGVVWEYKQLNISAAAGIKQIGFRSSTSGTNGGASLDAISSTAPVHLTANDLRAGKITFDEVARVNLPHAITCNVKNISNNSIAGTAYTAKLYTASNTLLSTISGVTLAPWEEHNFTFTHSFSSVSTNGLYVKVDFALDSDQSNNSSKSFKVYSVPTNAVDNHNGQPNTLNLNLPFNATGSDFTLGSDDVSQTIYLSAQMEAGYIYGYKLKVRNVINGSRKLPLKIWLDDTPLNTLTGWLPSTNFTLVFDDTIEVHSGIHEVYIPFSTPYLYSGSNNLLVQSYQYNPEWPSLATSFYSNGSASTTRTHAALDVYLLDPFNPPTGNYLQDYAYANFIVDTLTDVCNVSGIVSNTSALPISGAKVKLIGYTIQDTSDATGYYALPPIPYGTFQIMASKVGYYDSTLTVTLNASADTIDFTLASRAQLQIMAYVTGSDAPTVPIQNANATAAGYSAASANSNAAGEVVLTGVYADASYTITFSKKGYLDYVIAVNTLTSNINLDTIVLQQALREPYNVIASDAGNAVDVLVSWQEPLKGTFYQQIEDFNEPSFSLTNDPNENVWLGNYFANSDTITLTSAELYFDIYQNAHDYLTIDVFDENEELLVSSLPFQTFNDTTMVIDIPNITIVGDYYVMVHWQNNPLSTDALTLDLTLGIVNNARIKYPNTGMQTLGVYVPGIPDGAFHLRANYINDDVLQLPVVVGYNVSRGLLTDVANVNSWPNLNASSMTNTSFVDTTMKSAATGVYVYAVEAAYSSSASEKTISTKIDSKYITVEENQITSQINFYPNPASSIVSVRNVTPGTRIALYNQLGQVVLEYVSRGDSFTLNVSGLSAGLYLVHFTKGAYTEVQKLIVE